MGNPVLSKDKRRGQAVLETAACAVLMVILLAAITNVWLWANRQIVLRQKAYNRSRVAAGTSVDNYVLQWPVYQPEALGEAAVLRAPRR